MIEEIYGEARGSFGDTPTGFLGDDYLRLSPYQSERNGAMGMGYKNMDNVWMLSELGRFTKRRGGKLTNDYFALNVMLYMARNTYDWPPESKIKNAGLPCRYYTLGWKAISAKFAMGMLSMEQLEDPELNADKAREKREGTAKSRISDAWVFLQRKGLLKCLQPPSLGKNAGYLLLIGSDEENADVEAWARECLNLPKA